MKKTAVFTLTLLVLSTIGLQTAFAQDSPQLNLPEGATARLGKGRINELAYSPDGTRLAVASSIGIWLYDTATGREIALLTGHTDEVRSVAFSPDGSTIASGSRDATIRLWDAETGTHQRTLTGHRVHVYSVAFSPDGSTIASGSLDATIRLWDATTGTHQRTLTGHRGTVYSVAFSPDGSTIASGSSDATIRLWDAETGTHQRTLTGHIYDVNSVAFSPDGRTIASSDYGVTIRLWDAETGTHQRTLTGHRGTVNSVALSPDGSTIASGSLDATIRLWDAETGTHQRTLTGHTDWVNSVAFSPDGSTIASGSLDATIRLWDATTGTHQRTLTGHIYDVNSVAFSPDGSTILSGGGPHDTIRLWNATTGTHQRILITWVSSVVFSPDGGTIASGRSDAIFLRNATTGKTRVLTGHWRRVNSVAFSPDGGTIASGSDDATIRLWDADTGRTLRTFRGHTEAVNSVAFSPDGGTIASGSDDATIRLWDAETGTHQHTLTGHIYDVNSVAFSPDGRTIASGSDDATIRLWDAETGTHQRTLTGHTDWVRSVAFSPDGSTIASGSLDATIRLWDAETGTHQHTLTGHIYDVNSVAFSPDGGTIASGSWDGTVILWDVSEWMGPRPTPTDVRGPSVSKMSNVTDGEEDADLEVLNRDGIIIEFDEDIAWSSLKLTYEGGTDLGWVSTVKDNKVTLTPIEGQELFHETFYVVRGTVRDGVGNETDLTLTFVAVKSPVTTDNEPTPTTDSRQAFESSAPSGYTRVTLSNSGTVWGVPAKYTTDSNVGKVTYMLLAKVKECDFATAELARQSKVYIKTQSLGHLNNYQSETVCGISSSTWSSSWNGIRITHLRFFDESSSSNINEAIYNSSTGQYELTSAPTGLKEDVNSDGIVNILDLVLVASNLGQTGQNAGDVNGDGVVNILDLVKVAGALGNAAAAPSLYPQVLEMLTSADVHQWLTQAQHLNLTDATSQRGILFLEQLLAALTPKETALLPNYPNPFNPETWIPYRLAEDALVTLTIYDGSGRVVRTLDVGHRTAAFYESRSKAIHWDGRNEVGEGVASGVYFYHLSAGDYSATRKMLILK